MPETIVIASGTQEEPPPPPPLTDLTVSPTEARLLIIQACLTRVEANQQIHTQEMAKQNEYLARLCSHWETIGTALETELAAIQAEAQAPPPEPPPVIETETIETPPPPTPEPPKRRTMAHKLFLGA